jgi:hypothetical protein
MPFVDNIWGDEPFLVLTEATPGAFVKSPYEVLEPALPGQPDKLTLYYDGFFPSPAALNAALLALPAVATDLSATAVTAGTWIGGPAKLETDRGELPFARVAIPCLGLAESKPDAVRWFAVTESQSAENILWAGVLRPKLQTEALSVGVEIDRVLIGSAPNMSQVGTNITPPSAPSVRPSEWALIENPTYHYPNGWYLADIRGQQLHGSALAWLATYVYRYRYALTP